MFLKQILQHKESTIDLLLDKNTNDLIFINGATPVTVSLAERTAQRLSIRLLTFRGEYAFDTTYGVPYWQRIFGMKIGKSDVDLIYQQEILKEPNIREITSFSSTLSGRVYSCTFSAKLNTGQVTAPITITPTI